MPPLPFSAPDTPWPSDVTRTPALGAAGLTLGAGTVLAPMGKGNALALDPARALALLSVAAGHPVPVRALDGIRAAARHWANGNRVLANFRLLFAGLPRLEEPVQVYKAQAAEWLLDNGLSPRDLMRELGLDTVALDAVAGVLGKYNPDQPRVPAGNGVESGRWRGADDGAFGITGPHGAIHVSQLRFDHVEVTANGPLTVGGVETSFPGGVNPLDPKFLNKQSPTLVEQQAIVDALNSLFGGTKGEKKRLSIDTYNNLPDPQTGAVLPNSTERYIELTVRDTLRKGRGIWRILISTSEKMYYTNNHYNSFYRYHIRGFN